MDGVPFRVVPLDIIMALSHSSQHITDMTFKYNGKVINVERF